MCALVGHVGSFHSRRISHQALALEGGSLSNIYAETQTSNGGLESHIVACCHQESPGRRPRKARFASGFRECAVHGQTNCNLLLPAIAVSKVNLNENEDSERWLADMQTDHHHDNDIPLLCHGHVKMGVTPGVPQPAAIHPHAAGAWKSKTQSKRDLDEKLLNSSDVGF